MRAYTNGRITYHPVFKNASTAWRQAVLEAGWSQTTYPTDDGFAVVRHPVDRWWSGVHQHHVSTGTPHERLFEQARDGRMVFDQHTQPQVDQIPENILLIPFDDMDAHAERLGLNLRRIRVRDERIEAADLVSAILEYYAEDLALYERSRG